MICINCGSRISNDECLCTPSGGRVLREEAKPAWWPQCPYPETVFPMTEEEYVKAIPDPKLRTAISGFAGRMFWTIASDAIWNAIRQEG